MTTTTVTVRSRGRTIRAAYSGGPYVDLTFGAAAHASEVLNVWDYRAGCARLENTPTAVRAALMVWVEDMDADPDWPEWFATYEANA